MKRASGRWAVNLLGLLVLWAIVFSFAGSLAASPTSLAISAVVGAAGVWALHRFLIYCETRGWIYYRSGGGGDGRLSVSAEWLNMYDPSRRHMQETLREREWKRDEDDDGDGDDK